MTSEDVTAKFMIETQLRKLRARKILKNICEQIRAEVPNCLTPTQKGNSLLPFCNRLVDQALRKPHGLLPSVVG